VEFVRSHFLVREGVRFNRKGNSNLILQIDLIDKTTKRWKEADWDSIGPCSSETGLTFKGITIDSYPM
jgi:hypothetical protein